MGTVQKCEADCCYPAVEAVRRDMGILPMGMETTESVRPIATAWNTGTAPGHRVGRISSVP
jgi:hypothetical protein